MNIYFILKIFIAILPIFVLSIYIYTHDNEKEPTSMLVITFIAGILVCIPCYMIEKYLSNILDGLELNIFTTFIYVLISITLVEEIFKFIAVYITAYNDKNMNYTFDCIVYSTFAALGFAFLENLIYLNEINIESLILRGLTAVPLHVACGIIMGYYLSLTKNQYKKRKINFIKSIIYPTLIHTFYDYYLMYISNQLKLYFSFKTALIIEYTILIFLLTILFLVGHYLLVISSENDKKIKNRKYI